MSMSLCSSALIYLAVSPVKLSGAPVLTVALLSRGSSKPDRWGSWELSAAPTGALDERSFLEARESFEICVLTRSGVQAIVQTRSAR